MQRNHRRKISSTMVIGQLQDENVSCEHVTEQQAGEISMHALVMRNEMNSLENIRPGTNPLFLSQKIDAKEPQKKNIFHCGD